MKKPFYADNPTLLKEWNAEKNAPLLPERYGATSRKIVWWRCPEGHDYQMAIAKRLNSLCPICSDFKTMLYVPIITGKTYEEAANEIVERISESPYYSFSNDMMPEQGMTLPALSRGFFDSTVQEIDHAANAYLYEAERNSIDISSFLRIAEKMNSGSYRDIIPLLRMTYSEYVRFLYGKYGRVKGNYFIDSCDTCKKEKCPEGCVPRQKPNTKIRRTAEGLYIHHIDEYVFIQLSSSSMYQFTCLNHYRFGEPLYWTALHAQHAYRLVYADPIEHLLLHIKIAQGKHERPDTGVYLIAQTINSYYHEKPQQTWHSNMYRVIQNRYDEYILLLALYVFICKQKDRKVFSTIFRMNTAGRLENEAVKESCNSFFKQYREIRQKTE